MYVWSLGHDRNAHILDQLGAMHAIVTNPAYLNFHSYPLEFTVQELLSDLGRLLSNYGTTDGAANHSAGIST